MPYIHPDLGVPCMTVSEFWASESKFSGKEISETMEEYYTSIAEDEDRSAKDLMNNKSEVLSFLQNYYHPDFEEVEFLPVEVIDVFDVSVRYTPKKSMTSFKAYISCNDGKFRTVEYFETSWSGSYMDPPDFECECTVLEIHNA